MNRPITFSEWWQVLQIAQTEDVKQIRRAYAALVKQTRPEDDPEAFQRLRTAYEAAMSWARDRADAQSASGESGSGGYSPTNERTATQRSAADTVGSIDPVASGEKQGNDAGSDIGEQAFQAFDTWLRGLPEDVWHYRISSMGDLASGNDLRIVDSLTKLRLSTAFVHLEFADAFEYHALRYAAHQNAAPAVRLALAEVYSWDRDVRTASRFGQDLARDALWLASADFEMAKFVHGRRGSPATSLLLEGKRPAAAWKPIASDVLDDMRKVLTRLDGELRFLRDRMFDPVLLDAWRNAVLRPRITEGNIASIAAFVVGVITLGGLAISGAGNNALLTFFKAHETLGLLMVLGGGLLTVGAVCGLLLGATYRFGPGLAQGIRNFCSTWEVTIGRKPLVVYGWYGLAMLGCGVSIVGGGGQVATVIVAVLSLAGFGSALLVSLPYILRSLSGLLSFMFFQMGFVTFMWIGLVYRMTSWDLLNCATIAFGAIRMLPEIRERMRNIHEMVPLCALVLLFALDYAGVTISPPMGEHVPTWLLVGTWLWFVLLNLAVSIFFVGYLTHWFFCYPLWAILGSTAAGLLKTLPRYDAAVIGVMVLIVMTGLFELWRLWMLREMGGRRPAV